MSLPNEIITGLAFWLLALLKLLPTLAKSAAYHLGEAKSGAAWVGLQFIPTHLSVSL
jgi:hypothetical protein